MLSLKTRKELEQIIRDDMGQKPGMLTGVMNIGLTGSSDKKWAVFIVADGAPVRGDALRHAEIISERLMQEFDLAELVPLPTELNIAPGVGYRAATLRTIADIDDFEQWVGLASIPSNNWLNARQAIDAAKSRPTPELIRAATTFTRGAMVADGTLVT